MNTNRIGKAHYHPTKSTEFEMAIFKKTLKSLKIVEFCENELCMTFFEIFSI